MRATAISLSGHVKKRGRQTVAFLLFAIGCLGCVTARSVPDAQGPFVIVSPNDLSADVEMTVDALKKAIPLLAAQNRVLHERVTLKLVHTTDQLNRTKDATGWLKARAYYSTIILVAPSTWSPSQESLVKLLVHEISHCFSFQNMGSPTTWNNTPLPFWFLEGGPTLLSSQSAELPSLEDSARWAQKENIEGVLQEGSAAHPREGYAVALHAYAFFVKRFGREAGDSIEKQMAQGLPFDVAFELVTRTPHAAFRKDFVRFLFLRAFRGSTNVDEPALKKLLLKKR
jgi:hypothetical protein